MNVDVPHTGCCKGYSLAALLVPNLFPPPAPDPLPAPSRKALDVHVVAMRAAVAARLDSDAWELLKTSANANRFVSQTPVQTSTASQRHSQQPSDGGGHVSHHAPRFQPHSTTARHSLAQPLSFCLCIICLCAGPGGWPRRRWRMRGCE